MGRTFPWTFQSFHCLETMVGFEQTSNSSMDWVRWESAWIPTWLLPRLFMMEFIPKMKRKSAEPDLLGLRESSNAFSPRAPAWRWAQCNKTGQARVLQIRAAIEFKLISQNTDSPPGSAKSNSKVVALGAVQIKPTLFKRAGIPKHSGSSSHLWNHILVSSNAEGSQRWKAAFQDIPDQIFPWCCWSLHSLPLIWHHFCHSSSLSPITQILEFFIPPEPWSPLFPQHPTEPAQTFCSPNFSFYSFSFWTQQEPWSSGNDWHVLQPSIYKCVFLDSWMLSPEHGKCGYFPSSKIIISWATKASKTLMMDFSYYSALLGPKCICQRRFVSKYNLFFLANRDCYFLKLDY